MLWEEWARGWEETVKQGTLHTGSECGYVSLDLEPEKDSNGEKAPGELQYAQSLLHPETPSGRQNILKAVLVTVEDRESWLGIQGPSWP
jgi:hypothetical protein